MTDPTDNFFRELGTRGGEPMLTGITATVRFDITGGDGTAHWRIAVTDGAVDVSTDGGDADCVIVTDRSVFNGIVNGEVNAMAALLRGELSASGNPELVVGIQRLFPGPSPARYRQPAVATGQESS